MTSLARVVPALTVASLLAIGAGAMAQAPAAAHAPCTWCPLPSPPTCKLCVVQNPLLAVGADGKASGLLRVCNKEREPVRLTLYVLEFHAAGPDGQQIPLAASTRLAAASSAVFRSVWSLSGYWRE
jgi:hypothetical protein